MLEVFFQELFPLEFFVEVLFLIPDFLQLFLRFFMVGKGFELLDK